MKKYWQKIKQFLVEVKQEMKKVSWPDRKEVRGSTAVVIVTIIISLVFLYSLDLIFSAILNYIFLK